MISWRGADVDFAVFALGRVCEESFSVLDSKVVGAESSRYMVGFSVSSIRVVAVLGLGGFFDLDVSKGISFIPLVVGSLVGCLIGCL